LPGSRELLVYTVALGKVDTGVRLFPRRAVVVQDLATGRVISLIEYSAAGEFPVGVELAGRGLVIATEVAVTIRDLDGSNALTLLLPGAGDSITDVAVSPDGLLVAAATMCPGQCGDDRAAVTFVAIGDGKVVSMVPAESLRAAGFLGYAWQLRWRDDGRGVFLSGGTASERPGGRALVRTDGSVTVYEEPRGFGSIAPNGRLMADGVGQLPCEFIGASAVRISELDTGRVLLDHQAPGKVFSVWEWAPDSSAVLVTVRQGSADNCDWTRAPREFRLYDLASATFSTVSELQALHARWYGVHLFETICEDRRQDAPILDRWGSAGPGCHEPAPGEAIGDVFVGGERVARWPSTGTPALLLGIEPVGFLPTVP
jgi:hypothetical protein